MTSRVHLEDLLRSRGFGSTLPAPFPTAAELPSPETLLRKGAPAGHIVELVPEPAAGEDPSSGAGSLACHLAARVTSRATERPGSASGAGRVGWLDPCNRFDPLSALRAGIDLEQLLWVRGEEPWAPQRSAAYDAAVTEHRLSRLARFFEALYMLVHCGDFELLVLDLSTWPVADLRQLERSDWLRLLRAVERVHRTAVVILTPAPLAGSCGSWVVGVGKSDVRWRRGGRAWLNGLMMQTRALTSRRGAEYSVRTTHPLRVPLELRP